MPNWKIHLCVAKRIEEELGYTGEEKELFLLGSILPDINNGFVIKDISKRLSHEFTHFKNNEIATYKNFYEKHKDYLNKPIVCGYFVHLYTDYFWNKDFYKRIKNFANRNLNNDELRIIKQNDFRKYNNKYIEEKLYISNYKRAEEESRLINRVSITEKDIKNMIDYFNNQKESNNDFKVYNEDDLDKLMNDTIDSLMTELKRLA